MMSSHVVIGVDVGGTFTDILALNEHSEGQSIQNSINTGRPINWIFGCILEVSKNVKDVGTIIHGTTVATNALLERNGAKPASSLHQVFVMYWRCGERPPYNLGLWGQFTPVVQRVDRLEVEEHFGRGTVRVAVDLMEAERAAKTLLKNAWKVCLFFINGYANPKNEKRAAESLRKICLMSTLALQQKFFLKSENLRDVQRLL